MLCRARRCPLQNTEIFHQINRKIRNWEMTMEYEVDREIHDWEQINREIRNWKMTMEYEIDCKFVIGIGSKPIVKFVIGR